MDESAYNSLVQSAKAKNEGALRRKKILLILGYALFAVVYLVVFLVPVNIPAALGGLPFFLLAFWRITWWRLDYDYDYVLAHGELTVERIWSRTRRRAVAHVSVKDATELRPYPSGAAAPRERGVLDLRGSRHTQNGYLIRYRGEEGREVVLLCEVNEKMVKTMKKYNPATVMLEGAAS